MNTLVPIMLFGWPLFAALAFAMLTPSRAVLVTMIGGWLFLPPTEFNLPGLPAYTKAGAIAVGLMVGTLVSGGKGRARFELKWFDAPIIIFCLGAVATALSNDLGLYDGASAALQRAMLWAVPYYFGRLYFRSPEALKDLAIGLVIGGVAYALLCLWEIRMSPRLNLNIYGFRQHSWRQHIRSGGWRPMVFMDHGLMVALWMAVTTTVSFWLWRSRVVTHVRGYSLAYITPALAVTTVLCKSAGAWATLALGVGSYFAYRAMRMRGLFIMLLLAFPSYTTARITGLVTAEEVETVASSFFGEERVESLVVRLSQEDPFIDKALNRPILGWGGHRRFWPTDPLTGERLVQRVDSLWLITFADHGLVGLLSLYASLALGPLLALGALARGGQLSPLGRIMPVILCLPIGLYLVDSAFNSMINPVYAMVAGALAGFRATRP